MPSLLEALVGHSDWLGGDGFLGGMTVAKLGLQAIGARGEDWRVFAVAQRLQALAPAPDAPFAR